MHNLFYGMQQYILKFLHIAMAQVVVILPMKYKDLFILHGG